jgi:hypothetical protein
MGIEPTRAPLPELENTGFHVMPTLKCDGGVNFRGMWGNVGMRWSLFGRDFAPRPVDAPCGPLTPRLGAPLPSPCTPAGRCAAPIRHDCESKAARNTGPPCSSSAWAARVYREACRTAALV